MLAGISDVRADTMEILEILRDRSPPAPSPVRPHNLPPWMSPEYFIGREQELRALGEAGGGASVVSQPRVIIGASGVGKTRLAVQVAWVLYLEGKCEMALFASASKPSELDAQLAAFDAPSLLNLHGDQPPPKEFEERRQAVIHELRKTVGRWLLLLDAADSVEARNAVNHLFQELAGGRFLVTSRREGWLTGTVHELHLSLFTLHDALRCLKSFYWKLDPSVSGFEVFLKVVYRGRAHPCLIPPAIIT
jgi:hypothetical protein